MKSVRLSVTVLKKGLIFAAGMMFVIFLTNCAGTFQHGWTRPEMPWPEHSMERPQPPVITPGTASTQQEMGQVPSDAIVLYRNASDISKWEGAQGGPAKWMATNDYMQVVKGTGAIQTKEGFGDCQLHVEWAAPVPAVGQGQDRGNSGVFLQGLYEVQVLDCFNNVTYADGMTAALYGQYPPQVNACRPPGEWQTYDIIFQRPRFDDKGKVVTPAIMTVFFNGVLVQNHQELTGPTAHKVRPPYKVTPAKLPLQLQDHGHPVRYRNIWVRELPSGNQ